MILSVRLKLSQKASEFNVEEYPIEQPSFQSFLSTMFLNFDSF